LSLVPALLNTGQQKQHEFLYWEFHEGGSQQAVRTGDWKAIRTRPNAPLELYNLATDLHEDHDVAARHPDVVARVEGLLLAPAAPAAPPVSPPGAPVTFEAHVRPLLKAHCFECHGEGKKLRGGLDLRLRRLMAEGGDSGPAVVPGKRTDSPLYLRVQK